MRCPIQPRSPFRSIALENNGARAPHLRAEMGGERTRPPSPPLLFLAFGAGRFAARHAIAMLWVPQAPSVGAPNGRKEFQGQAPNSAGLSMGASDKRADHDQGVKR